MARRKVLAKKFKPTAGMIVDRNLIALERKDAVMDLYRKRYRAHEIAKILGLDLRVVDGDIQAYLAQVEKDGIENAAIVRTRELLDLDQLEREAIERLERLKNNPHQGSRWAEIVLACKDRRSKLIGLDAEQKFEVKHNVNLVTKEQRDAIYYAALGGREPVITVGDEGKKKVEYRPLDQPELLEKVAAEEEEQEELDPAIMEPTEREMLAGVLDAAYDINSIDVDNPDN
jgi:hypothetical protein